MSAPVIVAARRSPIGRAGGGLRQVGAADLAAPVLAAVRSEVDAHPVSEVVLGNCMGPGGDVARVAALAAGLPVDVPGLTVDRQCGSGLAAITVAAALVSSQPGLVLAGGVESASTQPWRSWPPVRETAPVRYLRAPFAPPGFADPDMGEAADRLAAAYGIGREAQDVYAARSHARAVAAAAAGDYAAELVPVAGLDRDERPRASVTPGFLSRMSPEFRTAADGGTVTIGNSCGVNDGAAVVAVLDGESHARTRSPGLRILACASAGVDPDQPGIGLVPATRVALDRAGVGLDEIDVVELNEAFAGQILACCTALDLDPARVCPQGGALALGHPWGASGAVLVVRLFSQLVRTGRTGALGLAAIAVGGGQGVAMVVQAC
ncbi:MAG TPA: thiolase family protein [Propionibacteriaceae bacterium]